MIVTICAEEIIKDGVSTVVVHSTDIFDVGKVFDCGQSFRFDPVTNTEHDVEFAGCAYGKYISVAMTGSDVYIYNVTLDEYESLWSSYLGLDRDYANINADILSLSDNAALADAVLRASGIRILRQEPWEAICSFIISQNNNIPRIKKLVAALCYAAGDEIDVLGMEKHVADAHKAQNGHFYSFPSPERVLGLGVSGLAEIKMGFRAKYVYDAAEKMTNGSIDLSLLENADTDECIKHLCSVKGIGPKVASCALLFGFSKLDAFPVDVWIKKVMAKYFSEDFEPQDLGKYAGIAQQYLFYYERYLQSNE